MQLEAAARGSVGGETSRRGAPASAAEAWLYDRLPRLAALIRAPEARLALDALEAGDAAPDSHEWAEAIAEALDRAAVAGRFAGGSFAVRAGGELLLGLEEADAEGFATTWREALEALGEPAAELETFAALEGAALAAIEGRIELDGHECAALFVLPDRRGRGLGDRFAELLAETGRMVAAHRDAGDLDYWIERGFRVAERGGDWIRLESPLGRDDVRPAASVCLLDAARRAVLLGRRLHPPWPGYWAFPGGGQEAGETLLEAARRELEEETAIRVSGRPIARRAVWVGSGEGERVYRVTNFLFVCYEGPEARPSDEMEGRWVGLDEAPGLRPMAAGTRRVIRSLPF